MNILSKYNETNTGCLGMDLLDLQAEYLNYTQQLQGDKYRVIAIRFAGSAVLLTASKVLVVNTRLGCLERQDEMSQ